MHRLNGTLESMDDFKKLASRAGGLCPFWKCWENDGKRNKNRRIARRYGRKRLKQRDQREWVAND